MREEQRSGDEGDKMTGGENKVKGDERRRDGEMSGGRRQGDKKRRGQEKGDDERRQEKR